MKMKVFFKQLSYMILAIKILWYLGNISSTDCMNY